MNETGIIWTERTWNPMSGCDEVSEGCKFCYAKTLSENKRGTPAFPNGFDLTIRPHKLNEPLKLKEPSLIFVNSMSDLFWERVDDEYRDRILDVIEKTPHHQYQVLTKRPENLLRYSKRRVLPSNFWAGVTVEHHRVAYRIDILRRVEAEIRFVSAEPLISRFGRQNLSGIHWMITGGESGSHLREQKWRELRSLATINDKGKWVPHPERIDYVREVRDLCLEQGVRFFHKQWGGPTSHSAGRLLDGRTWDEFPRYPGDKTECLNTRLKIVRPETTQPPLTFAR